MVVCAGVWVRVCFGDAEATRWIGRQSLRSRNDDPPMGPGRKRVE